MRLVCHWFASPALAWRWIPVRSSQPARIIPYEKNGNSLILGDLLADSGAGNRLCQHRRHGAERGIGRASTTSWPVNRHCVWEPVAARKARSSQRWADTHPLRQQWICAGRHASRRSGYVRGCRARVRAIRSPEVCVAAADNPILSSQYGDHTMYPQVDICLYTLIPVTTNTFTPLLRYPVTLHRHRCFGEPATDAASGTVGFSDVPPSRHQRRGRIARIPKSGGHGNDHRDCADRALDQLGYNLEPGLYAPPPGSTTLATLVMSSARSPNRMASRHAGRKLLDGASPRPHPAMGVTAGGSTGSQYVWQQGSDLIDQHQIN